MSTNSTSPLVGAEQLFVLTPDPFNPGWVNVCRSADLAKVDTARLQPGVDLAEIAGKTYTKEKLERVIQ